MFTQISQAPLAHCLLKHAKFEIFILKKSRSMSSLMGIKVPTRRKNRLAKKDYTTVVSVLPNKEPTTIGLESSRVSPPFQEKRPKKWSLD